jgi:hypothetical protein
VDTHLPLPKPPPWRETAVANAVFAALPVMLTSLGGIVTGLLHGERAAVVSSSATLAAAVFGYAIALARARAKDRHEAEGKSPADLEGCLYILHASVLAILGFTYEEANIKKLRVTIHRVLDDGASRAFKVRQLVPYVPAGSSSVPDQGKGREMPSRCGIVGRAITRRKPQGLIRSGTFDDYVKVMCDEYGFLPDEARQLTPDRHAFLAIPLMRGGRVVGVVYLDSPEHDFFSEPDRRGEISPLVVGAVTTACGGLAPYTSLRYPE